MNKPNQPWAPIPSGVGGFTLVELMVVVAIISILAAIAIPNYRNYTERARASAMLAEVSGGKVGVESLLMEGQIARVITPADVGLKSPTELCPILTVDTYIQPGDRRVRIFCGGYTSLVELWYSSSTGWSCKANTLVAGRDWTPAGCNPV